MKGSISGAIDHGESGSTTAITCEIYPVIAFDRTPSYNILNKAQAVAAHPTY
jgi:hypothetical protein